MNQQVPDYVVNAVNTMLAPFGAKFESGCFGYKSVAGAAEYLGISRSGLYRLINEGALTPIKLNSAKNGKIILSVADLEHFVQSRR